MPLSLQPDLKSPYFHPEERISFKTITIFFPNGKTSLKPIGIPNIIHTQNKNQL